MLTAPTDTIHSWTEKSKKQKRTNLQLIFIVFLGLRWE